MLWFIVKTHEYMFSNLQWRHMSTSLHVMIYSEDIWVHVLWFTVKTHEYMFSDLQWRHMSTCSLIYSENIWVHHYMLWFTVKTYEYITTCYDLQQRHAYMFSDLHSSEDIWVQHYMLWFTVKTHEYMFSNLQWRHMSTSLHVMIYSEDTWVHVL